MILPAKNKGKASFQHAESILAVGFMAVILLGTALLALPIAAAGGQRLSLFDSLFTATSAVCVTGLVSVDTGTTFSLFGQIVLIVLIQVGGLGFMVFATIFMVMLGRKISIKGRMLIRESMNTSSMSDLGSLTKLYLLLSLAIELAGAVLLSVRFVPLYGWKHGIWIALFHSVSAFCNAGFDLFGNYASLTAFSGDPLVLLTVAVLIILGGLGFSVILETIRNRQGAGTGCRPALSFVDAVDLIHRRTLQCHTIAVAVGILFFFIPVAVSHDRVPVPIIRFRSLHIRRNINNLKVHDIINH